MLSRTNPLQAFMPFSWVELWIAFTIAAFIFLRLFRKGRKYFRPAQDFSHYLGQLTSVQRGVFYPCRLMNASERQLFNHLQTFLRHAQFQNFSLFSQVSLGEIVKSAHPCAFKAINSKRLDFIITDSEGWPVVAIEYQGAGHYNKTALLRDEIKKTALEKAGIPYVEIFPSYTPSTLEKKLTCLLRKKSRDGA